MNQDDLLRELERLAERVARLEEKLEIKEPPEPEHEGDREADSPPTQAPMVPPTVPPPLASDLVEKKRRMHEAAEPHAPSAAASQAPPPAADASKVPEVVEPSPEPAAPPVAPPTTPPSIAPTPTGKPPTAPPSRITPPPRTRPPKPETSLEQVIGGRWAAWLGAAAVFAAALFAIKIAIDQGWWGMLSPAAKFVIIGVSGGLITAAGELVLRKVNLAASVGLYSAGLGVLYLDSFATFRYWDLFSKEWAFVLMGIVALGGFALTWRTKTLTIGVLSIAGGYLTPVLLRGQTQHDVEMLSFLTMLLGISLGLAGVSPRPFGPMRFVALGFLSVVGLGWLFSNGPGLWVMAIVFMSVWWTMVLTESVVAALREHSTKGNIVMTLLTTAGFATAGCWVLSAGPVAGSDWTGGFTVMIAVLAAATALQFGPGIDGLRVFPRRAMDKLAVALWVQAGILLATAIALHFDDYGRSAGWLIVGLGAIETGRRLPSRGLDIFGLVVGGLGVLDVWLVSWWLEPRLQNTIEQWGQLEITGWSILALIGIALTIAAAHRINDHWPNHWKIAPIVLASLAGLGWIIWWYAQAAGLLVTTGWLIGAGLLLGAQRVGDRQRYFELGQLLLLAAAARWAVVDLFQDRFEGAWDPFGALPVINARTALAVAIALAGWWVYAILRRRERDGTSRIRLDSYGFQLVRQAAVLFIIGIALLALSFDIDRIVMRLARADAAIDWIVGHVRQNLLTLLWSVGSLVLGVLGRLVSQKRSDEVEGPPRLLIIASTVILVVCAFKWLIYDTFYWVAARDIVGTSVLLPVVNVQMITGLVLAATGLLIRKQVFTALEPVAGVETGGGWRDPAAWVPAVAAVIILWGASFELDRIISRFEANADGPLTYPPVLLRALWFNGLWALGGMVMVVVGQWRKLWVLLAAGGGLIVAWSVFWMIYCTAGWRLMYEALEVPVILNLQCLIGVALLGLLLGAERVHSQIVPHRLRQLYGRVQPRWVAYGLGAALGLWLGTLELDRLFADDITVRLASFSVWWGVYGVALVAAGFAKRLPVARYAGLGLLAITAAKVLFIDMAEAKNIWRVVSFLACGLLLIVTSIAYAKLGQRLKTPKEAVHHGDSEGRQEE